MKTLRESLFDQDITSDNIDEAVIRKWIDDNYTYKGSIILNDKKVNVDGNISAVNKDIIRLLPEGWSFGSVNLIDLSNCDKLKTLEGFPEKVKLINLLRCESLKTLEGLPRKLDGVRINLSRCTGLKSLKGIPQGVIDINIGYCKVKDLTGMPKTVQGDVSCMHCDNLKSLEGAPDIIKGTFMCRHCKNLKSLEGMSKYIGHGIDCRNCPIEDYSILDKVKIDGLIIK